MIENNILHTKWNCTYHIVFNLKRRNIEVNGKLIKDIGPILMQLHRYKSVETVDTNLCSDHIHIMIKISLKMSVSGFMGYLKIKSSLMMFDQHANVKYKY